MKQAVNHLSVLSHCRFTRVAAAAFSCMLALCIIVPTAPLHAQPVTSDSRIKTFVYNPNEVFSITTHYGYQSNVEFAQKETIETISVGDRVAWQIIPAGRRLFIRAMEENARTNMTVVTNQRAYQFELRSSSANAVFGSESLTYVVRFFYPTAYDAVTAPVAPIMQPVAAPLPQAMQSRDLPPPLPAPVASAPAPTAALVAAPTPVITQTAPAPSAPAPRAPEAMPLPAPYAPPAAQTQAAALPPVPLQPAPPKQLNYRYTFSGPNDIAPTKIYDDGKTTYFKLPGQHLPKFAILTAAGGAIDVPARRTHDGLVAVDAIAQSFRLKQADRDVVVYNEAGGEVN